MPLYPEVEVQLVGEDGNAFFIVGRVRRAMEKAGLWKEAKVFFNEALAQPSYDALLQHVMRTVSTK